MILAGPGEFELRPEINPMKVPLVYNILNSIIYFSLVRQDKNRICTTRYIIQTNAFFTNYGTVFLHAALYYEVSIVTWPGHGLVSNLLAN